MNSAQAAFDGMGSTTSRAKYLMVVTAQSLLYNREIGSANWGRKGAGKLFAIFLCNFSSPFPAYSLFFTLATFLDAEASAENDKVRTKRRLKR